MMTNGHHNTTEDDTMDATVSKLSLAPTLATIPVAIAVALIVFGALRGWRMPLIEGDRAALLAVVGVGFVMCALAGPWISVGQIGIGNPTTIAGIVLGACAVLVIVSAFTGLWLPGIGTHRAALLALSAIITLKVGLAFARYWA